MVRSVGYVRPFVDMADFCTGFQRQSMQAVTMYERVPRKPRLFRINCRLQQVRRPIHQLQFDSLELPVCLLHITGIMSKQTRMTLPH